MNCSSIKRDLFEIEQKLLNHKLYETIKSLSDVKCFLEIHVLAVWDFMSLLKKLQLELTSVKIPWVPTNHPQIRYLINEIVLAEETDINLKGERKSHFELYYDAMKLIGADTSHIDFILEHLKSNKCIFETIDALNLDNRVKEFLNYTFRLIEEGKPHKIASAFTFGREDLIPSMFTSLLKELEKDLDTEPLIYYFERHIELDEDEHGPMALEMINELCQSDPLKWEEARLSAREALDKRFHFWNAIKESISVKTSSLV
jgi:hypothetical protein